VNGEASPGETRSAFEGEGDAEDTLKAVLAWRRLAEFFVCDEADRTFGLEAA